MYSSTYLKWFRRLLILGAVVAGLTASAAGARLDPGTPPDVSDVASALSTPATIVSRPPDVRDAAVNTATPDAFERYAAAHPYGSGLSQATTPVDRIIAQEEGRQNDLGLFSLGLSTPVSSTFVSSPPDVQDAMSALHSTPAGVKADGLRWQGIAKTYTQLGDSAVAQNTTPEGLKADGQRYTGIAQIYKSLQSDSTPVRPDDRAGPLGVGEPTSVPASGGSSFDWNDYAIGIGTGIGVALLLGAGLLFGRQRHRVLPA